MFEQRIADSVKCQIVGPAAKSCYHTKAYGCYQGCVAKGFAGVDIGQVDFHYSCATSGNGVPQGDGGVRVGSCIQDHRSTSAARFLYPGNQIALMVGLVALKPNLSLITSPAKACFNIHQRHATINIWFAPAKEVQVWSVDQVYWGHWPEVAA